MAEWIGASYAVEPPQPMQDGLDYILSVKMTAVTTLEGVWTCLVDIKEKHPGVIDQDQYFCLRIRNGIYYQK